jgi:PAS domain S-box-containing protein
MKDEERTKDQLINELQGFRRKVAQLEAPGAEIKGADNALRESENKYRTLLENLPQMIFLKDRNSVYLSCNDNYARDLNIKADEIAGKTDHDFYPTELAEKYRTDDSEIMESGETKDIEETYLKEGKEYTVHTVKTPIKDNNGQVIGVLGIFWDITSQVEIGEILETSQMLRDLAEQMLGRMGYEVEAAKEGLEAIEIYRKAKKAGQPFDAVIHDFTIKGGMGGKEAIKELLKIDPDVKAIISSGYSNDPIMSDFGAYGFRSALPKPYQMKGLKEVLEKVLSQEG